MNGAPTDIDSVRVNGRLSYSKVITETRPAAKAAQRVVGEAGEVDPVRQSSSLDRRTELALTVDAEHLVVDLTRNPIEDLDQMIESLLLGEPAEEQSASTMPIRPAPNAGTA